MNNLSTGFVCSDKKVSVQCTKHCSTESFVNKKVYHYFFFHQGTLKVPLFLFLFPYVVQCLVDLTVGQVQKIY